MVLALPIHMHREREVLARRKQVQLLLQQQRIRAHVNVLFPRHQSRHDLRHLRMQQRLAARNRNHRRAALLSRLEAFLRRELRLQNVRGILDLAASGARQVAAEQRLQHQHQGILLAPFQLLLQHVSCDGPCLRDRHCHSESPFLSTGAPPRRNTRLPLAAAAKPQQLPVPSSACKSSTPAAGSNPDTGGTPGKTRAGIPFPYTRPRHCVLLPTPPSSRPASAWTPSTVFPWLPNPTAYRPPPAAPVP